MANRSKSARSLFESQGFTLIEIAVVLVIIALVASAGVGLTAAFIDNQRNRVTRQNLDQIRQALQAAIIRNGRLPCPAVETRTSSDTDYGVEAGTPGTCTGSTDLPGSGAIDSAQRGVVPWKTLGMTTDNAFDGWGNQITYMVATKATNTTMMSAVAIRGSIYVHSATPVAAALPPTGNQINACSTTANDNSCNAAAVVALLSHGKNGAGAYTAGGVRTPLPTGSTELENTNADRFLVNAEPGGSFDDIVYPISPDNLLAPLYVQGVFKPERTVLNELARQWVALFAAEVVSDRTGSAGSYSYPFPGPSSAVSYTLDGSKFNSTCSYNPPTTVGVLPSGWAAKQILDPWGNEFRYARGDNAIEDTETCPNPAAIVSMGADGALGGGDDWVYYVPLADVKDIFGRAGW